MFGDHNLSDMRPLEGGVIRHTFIPDEDKVRKLRESIFCMILTKRINCKMLSKCVFAVRFM